MKRVVKLLSRRGSGIRCHCLPNWDFLVLVQWSGCLLKQEPECEDPTSWWGPVSPHWSTSPFTCLRKAGGPQFQFTLLKGELPSARLVGNTGSECLCSVCGKAGVLLCVFPEWNTGERDLEQLSLRQPQPSWPVSGLQWEGISSQSQGKALEGRGGKASLTASLHMAFELSFCPHLCAHQFELRFCPHNAVKIKSCAP